MKALVKYAGGPGNMEIREVPEPKAGPGEVLIKVAQAGICGSDLHIYHADIDIPVNPPVTTGHEFAGTVAAVGAGVTGIAPGDRVTSETAYSYCGQCRYCTTGFYNLCPQRRTLGYWYNGAFTDYTVVPADRVHHLPDAIDFQAGAMLEPLACITHAVFELTTLQPNDWVLVSGPGAIGLLTLQVAQSMGVRTIISGTAIDAERLALAGKLGATRVVNVQEEDLEKVCAELTGGLGVDVVLECSGAPRAVDTALRVIRKQGQFTQIGLFGKPITIDFERICFKELRVTGSLGSRRPSWLSAIKLVAEGKVQMAPLVSHKLPVSEWKHAFELFEKKEGLKLMLMPEGAQ